MVSGRIFKRINRQYKSRNHDSDRIELKVSWLRSDLCDQIFNLIFFGRVPYDQSWLKASQPWPWVEKFQILSGPHSFYMGGSYFIWSPATTEWMLYGQSRHGGSWVGFEPVQKINFWFYEYLSANWAIPPITTRGRQQKIDFIYIAWLWIILWRDSQKSKFPTMNSHFENGHISEYKHWLL